MRRQTNQRCFKDPVCGMQVSHNTAIEELGYEGKVYHFCAPICKEAFAASPEKFIKQHRQHGLSKAKSANV